jgi:hypothetical protein
MNITSLVACSLLVLLRRGSVPCRPGDLNIESPKIILLGGVSALVVRQFRLPWKYGCVSENKCGFYKTWRIRFKTVVFSRTLAYSSQIVSALVHTDCYAVLPLFLNSGATK